MNDNFNKSNTNKGLSDDYAENQPEQRLHTTYKNGAKKKVKLLKMLQQNMGIVKYACIDAGVDRSTYYAWLQNDPEFARMVNHINEDTGDYVERKLIGLIRSDDAKAIMFFCETKLKDRGYFRKSQSDTTLRTDEPVEITLDI